jgi:hypothetical protein
MRPATCPTGARSAHAADSRGHEARDALTDACGHAGEKAWAELEVLSATVFARLLKFNVLNSQGEPRWLLSEHRQMKLAQLQYETALGMTPLAVRSSNSTPLAWR